MKRILPETEKYIRERFPEIKIKKNKVLIETENGIAEIPSDVFPLWNKKAMEIFTYADTEPVKKSKRIKEIYDGLAFHLGRCYLNMENLEKAFLAKGESFSVYAGWLYIGGNLVHHAWGVYQGKHLLDPGVTAVMEVAQRKVAAAEIRMEDKEVLRKVVAETYMEMEKMENSKWRTFGRAASYAVYIGSETKPEKAREIFLELLKKYPDHPAYREEGMNARGASDVQKQILEKKTFF